MGEKMTFLKAGRYWGLAVLVVALGACSSAGTMVQTQPVQEAPAVKSDEAMVVFMRSSFFGAMIAASVFDVTDPGPAKFIGVMNNSTKIAYPAKPGDRTFMVVSESADFMKANLIAGKTYYAMVTPRMGAWKARFSFRPVRAKELGGDEFKSWYSDTQFVSTTPAGLAWADRNFADVNAKRTSYWADWASKAADERAEQTLNAEDGR
jgi:hypothetical protein